MYIINLNEITSRTLEEFKTIVESNPEETNFKIQINSNGGDLNIAFALYDYIRTSEKVWYANIESVAHSASIIVLLAVPFANRTANPLATSLIHQVYLNLRGDYNSTELETITTDINEVKRKMASIYADRTVLELDEALAVIDEEKERDAEWLFNKGFVSSINIYKNMKKGLFSRIKNLLKLENFEVKDVEGNVLFVSDEEELKVGGAAEPDGQFDVPELGMVTIEDGFITKIEVAAVEMPVETPETKEVEEVVEEATPITEEVVEEETPVVDEEKESMKGEIEELKKAIEEKNDEIEELKSALKDSLEAMRELKSTISSNYCPEKRVTNFKNDKVSTLEEVKANRKYFNK